MWEQVHLKQHKCLLLDASVFWGGDYLMQQLTRAFKTSGSNQAASWHILISMKCQCRLADVLNDVNEQLFLLFFCFMQRHLRFVLFSKLLVWKWRKRGCCPDFSFPFLSLLSCISFFLLRCFLSSGFLSFSFLSSLPHPYCVLDWLPSRLPGSRQTFSLDLPLSLSIRLFFWGGFFPKEVIGSRGKH